MNSSSGRDSFGSSGSVASASRNLHVSGRNRGIREIDLNFALAEPGCGDDADGSGMSEENALLLATITSLDLSRNEIELLSNLEALRSLRRLDVSYNLIAAVHGLPFTLTRLNLSHNRLRNLDGVARLPHLRELDVRANRLTNLASLSSRTPLQVLRADDNRLVSTFGLEDMPDLRLLSLANNFIERLEDLAFLSHAVSLQALTLKNNPVTQIDGYRLLVAQRQAALLSLDGAPLLRPRNNGDYRQHYATAMPAERSVFGGKERAAAAPRAVSASGCAAVSGGSGLGSSVSATPVRATAAGVAGSSRMPADDSPLFDDTFMNAMYGSRRSNAACEQNGERQPQHPYTSTAEAATTHDTSRDSLRTPVAERQAPQPTAATAVSSARTAAAGYARQFAEARAVAAAPHRQHRRVNGSDEAGGGDAKRAGEAAPAAAAATRSPRPRQRHRGGDAHRVANVSAASGPRSGVPRAAAAPPYASASSAAEGNAATERDDDAEDQRSPLARLHDCLVAKEQLEKENQRLRARVKTCEEQLADARRIVSEQLNDLSTTRVERDALRQAVGDAKERQERAKRHAKMMEAHHKEEVAALREQFERAKTFYEAQLADLRRQLAAEVTRAAARRPVATEELAAPATEAPTGGGGPAPPAASAAQRGRRKPVGPLAFLTPPPLAVSPRSPQPVAEAETPVSGSVAAADTSALAEQLKGWLYAQMADDMSRAEQEDLRWHLQRSLEADEEAARCPPAHTQGSEQHRASLPLEPSERAREMLEAFVLQQQQHVPLPSPPPADEQQAALAATVKASSTSPTDPQRPDPPAPEEPTAAPATRGSGRRSPVGGEAAVSRARPSLSPQRKC